MISYFTFLPYKYLVDISSTCKLFYIASRKNSVYVGELSHSRILFSHIDICSSYQKATLSFAAKLSAVIGKFLKGGMYLKIEKMVFDNLFFSFLQCRVWNHLFFCSRSHYHVDMYLFCTRTLIYNRVASNFIHQNLFVQITDINPSLKRGIRKMDQIYLTVHFLDTSDREAIPGNELTNFGNLFREFIDSPFLL